MEQQRLPDQVIVVDDGSDVSAAADNLRQVRSLGERGHLVALPSIRGGHGPAYARNAGIAACDAPYLCFLDDDDLWTDSDYLARLQRVIETGERPFDLHLANQHAFTGGARVERVIWIEDLQDIVAGHPADAAGAFDVSVEDLLACSGFCHLNATCVRRAFMATLGGFDDAQRYESDRDFYLRAIDAAECIKHSPQVVARHHIPDKAAGVNVSTAMPAQQRWLYQHRLLERAAITARHPDIRAYARLHTAYTMKKMSQAELRDGDADAAWDHARAALSVNFSLKWAAFTGWVGVRRLATTVSGRRRANGEAGRLVRSGDMVAR
jgi:glycosyltransferase involved in cell wall biosynthesis